MPFPSNLLVFTSESGPNVYVIRSHVTNVLSQNVSLSGKTEVPPMNPPNYRKTFCPTAILLSFVIWFGLGKTAHAAALTINNFSFELPVLGDGEISRTVPGWALVPTGNPVYDSTLTDYEVINPTASQFTGAAMSGSPSGWIISTPRRSVESGTEAPMRRSRSISGSSRRGCSVRRESDIVIAQFLCYHK